MTPTPLTTQRGFTLVELVVVIMILGILSATALPKFMNMQKDAHKSVVDGFAGTIGTAVQMAHAKFMILGKAGKVETESTSGVWVNSTGWPVALGSVSATPGTLTATNCKDVWENIIANPPAITAGNVSTATTTDWCTSVPTAATTSCVYGYLKDVSLPATAAACDTVATRYISYDSATGNLSITN